MGFEEVSGNVAIDIQMNFRLNPWGGFAPIIWITVEAGICNIVTNWKVDLLALLLFHQAFISLITCLAARAAGLTPDPLICAIKGASLHCPSDCVSTSSALHLSNGEGGAVGRG